MYCKVICLLLFVGQVTFVQAANLQTVYSSANNRNNSRFFLNGLWNYLAGSREQGDSSGDDHRSLSESFDRNDDSSDGGSSHRSSDSNEGSKASGDSDTDSSGTSSGSSDSEFFDQKPPELWTCIITTQQEQSSNTMKIECRAKTRGLKLYRLSNQKIYYFANNDLKTWVGAQDACSKLGMHLVTMETKFENLLVMDLINHEPFLSSVNIIFGLQDIDDNGEYIWETTGLPPYYTDADGTDLAQGECGVIHFAPDDTFWDTVDCLTDSFPYICEMEYPCAKYVEAIYVPISSH